MNSGFDLDEFNNSALNIQKSPIHQDDLVKHIEICKRHGLIIEAHRAWRTWCAQNPTNSWGWANAALSAYNAYFFEEAVFCASELLELHSGKIENDLFALSIMMQTGIFVSNMDQTRLNSICRDYSEILSQNPKLKQIPAFPIRKINSTHHKVKIGYSWNYFGRELEFCFPFHHNRDRFEVIAICPGAAPCPPDKIGVDRFLEHPVDDLDGAVRTIRASEIDVFIDLNARGVEIYSDMIVDARVAPVQALYGNFFSSVFSPSIDALIGDRAILEIIEQHEHTEFLIPLPETFMPIRNISHANQSPKPQIPPRRSKYRIGTTGNLLKLSPHFLELTSNILRAIPASTFLCGSFSTRDNIEYFKYFMKERGIGDDRLELFLHANIDYHSMIKEIDLAIDSLPANGHLSTYEFLSLGTPVWSLRGPRVNQRYGQMLMGHIGMSQWVFDSPEELIGDLVKNIRVKTPEDSARLAQRVADSGLDDPARATRLFEAAIETLLARETAAE